MERGWGEIVAWLRKKKIHCDETRFIHIVVIPILYTHDISLSEITWYGICDNNSNVKLRTDFELTKDHHVTGELRGVFRDFVGKVTARYPVYYGKTVFILKRDPVFQERELVTALLTPGTPLRISLDSFTVSLHSTNGSQIGCRYGFARDCRWPEKTVGIHTAHMGS